MKGFFKIYETAEANIKPLDSIAATLLNLNFFDLSIISFIKRLDFKLYFKKITKLRS